MSLSYNSSEPQKTAVAVYKNMRITPRKLTLVVNTITGYPVGIALRQLAFSKKPIAREVKKCLDSAIANAEHNYNLDPDQLIIAKAVVGKGVVMKRMMPRARGKGATIKKFFSNLRITVREQEIK